MWTTSISSQLLFTKNDKEDPRLGEAVHLHEAFSRLEDINPTQADFHILGYPDDEGIFLNGGRVGAQAAPDQIRTFLYKMTPSLKARMVPKIEDLGNLHLQDLSLAERHERARSIIKKLTSLNKKFITLGGGHDYGYSDACGFLDSNPQQAVVINFDAHLDVRPVDKIFHSGTPFRRMLNEYAHQMNFFEFGLQPQCNSQTHFKWAADQGAHLFTTEDMPQGLLPLVQQQLSPLAQKKLFISLDMDVFTSTEAPGCSQSWATGISIKDFLPTLTWLIQNFDVAGLGVYEVSPGLDTDNHTSKLAALILHHFIFETSGRK